MKPFKKTQGWIKDTLLCLVVIIIGYFIIGAINEVYYKNFLSLLFYFFIFPLGIFLITLIFLRVVNVLNKSKNLKDIILALYGVIVIPFIYELTRGFFYDYQKNWQNFTLIGITILIFMVVYIVLGEYIINKLE